MHIMYVVCLVLLEVLILLQVTALTDEHTCTSSGRRKTATPISAYVASLGAPILKKKLGSLSQVLGLPLLDLLS
jgi:hypothetical protein